MPDEFSNGSETSRPRTLRSIFLWSVAPLVIGTMAGYLYGYYTSESTPGVFRSTAQIYVSSTPNVGDGDNPAANIENLIARQESLLKSPEVTAEVGRHLTQAKKRESPDNYAEFIRSGLRIVRYRDTSTGALSNVLAILFYDSNPDDCLLVLDSLCRAYLDELQAGRAGERVSSRLITKPDVELEVAPIHIDNVQWGGLQGLYTGAVLSAFVAVAFLIRRAI